MAHDCVTEAVSDHQLRVSLTGGRAGHVLLPTTACISEPTPTTPLWPPERSDFVPHLPVVVSTDDRLCRCSHAEHHGDQHTSQEFMAAVPYRCRSTERDMSIIAFIDDDSGSDLATIAGAVADVVPLVRERPEHCVEAVQLLQRLLRVLPADHLISSLLAWWLDVTVGRSSTEIPLPWASLRWRAASSAELLRQMSLAHKMRMTAPRDHPERPFAWLRRRARHVGKADVPEFVWLHAAGVSRCLRQLLADLPGGRPTPLSAVELRLSHALAIQTHNDNDDVRSTWSVLSGLGYRLMRPPRPAVDGLHAPSAPGEDANWR
jgi:hypothetical protein